MRVLPVLTGVASLVLLSASISAQATWTGAASTSWDNPFNWDTGSVPTSTTDVVIASATNQPSSYIFGPSCNDLTINAGATLELGAGFDLMVGGDLVISSTATLQVTSASSDVTITGSWTNDGSFVHGGGMVEMDGTGTLDGTATSVFQDLVLSGGTRTANSNFTVEGDANVDAGTTLSLASTATVMGNWSSAAAGASTTGFGTVRLDGTGLLTTGLNGLPNLEIVSGTRSVNPSTVSGNLTMTGGTLQVLDNTTLIVVGDATLTGGTLTFQSTFLGNETFDIGGDAVMTCAAGSFSADVRILCAGNWTSSSAFVPSAGSIELDGGGTRTLSGTDPAFFNLRIVSGTVNATSAVDVNGTLLIDTGATLDADAAFTVPGSVVLGAAVGAWDMGGLEHTVAGDWTSAGMPANNGTIRFTAGADVTASGAAIDNVICDGGLRTTGSLSVTGDLTVSAGELRLDDGATVTVGGNATMSGGTLGFDDTSAAIDLLDVAGSVSMSGTLAGTMGASSEIHCGGDWTSDGTWIPGDGKVQLDGLTPSTIGGVSASFNELLITEGSEAFTVPTTITTNLTALDAVTLTSSAVVNVFAAVTLGDATTSWDLGGLTHTVTTDLTSTGASISNGTVSLSGVGGAIDLGGGTADNLSIVSGTRTMTSLDLSSLSMATGMLDLLAGAAVNTSGAVILSGGSLGMGAGSSLDAATSINLAGLTAGTIASDAVIRFGTTLTSSPSWNPGDGTVEYDGAGAGTITTATSFHHFTASSGTLTANGALTINGDLTLNGDLTSNSVSAVAGDVNLGSTVTWDLGTNLHGLAGDWTSTGGSAINGTVAFTAEGDLVCGGGTLDNVTVIDGVRLASTGSLTGDLVVTGGTFRINLDATFTVLGNATFTAGQIGWFPDASGPDETLIVEGDVTCDAAVEFEAPGSRLICRGDWSSGPAFVPNAAAVVLDGASPTTVGGTPNLFFVICQNSTRTLTADLDVRGNLVLSSGAAIDAAAAVLDVDGTVTTETGTNIELGALHHFVGGDMVLNGATVTGTGTIEFDNSGTLETGVGSSLPNALVSAGTRTLNTTVITDQLEMTGGTIDIQNDQVVTVGGLAKLTGGTLSFTGAGGVFETLDADSIELTATAGTMDGNSLILCAGDWSSTSAWSPSAGTVSLDGGGLGTVSGASPTFHDLIVLSGTKTLASATTVEGNFTTVAGQTVTTQDSLTVLGNATLVAGATWNSGLLAHTIHGDLVSNGATIADASTIELADTGLLDSGASTVPNILVSGGTRTANTSTIRHNLELTGGSLEISDNQTLTVEQNATLSGGTLAFLDTTAGLETLAVEGDVVTLASTSGATSENTRIVVDGNWSSDSTWSPAAGLVRLQPLGAITISGSGPIFANLELASGSPTMTVPGTINDDLTVDALLTTQGALAIGGNVALGGAGSGWDVTTETHTVTGDWFSAGGSATGTGEIQFTGSGSVDTSAGTLPNVRSITGSRSVIGADITGNLVIEGGSLTIEDDALAHVAGDFNMSAGTLGWTAGAPGAETLDVDGDVTISGGGAGGTSVDTMFRCGGSWSSGAGFPMAAGTVSLDGIGPLTVGGIGIDLPILNVASGDYTLTDAILLDELQIDSGATLATAGVMDVDGPVTLGDGSASLDMGGLSHTVSGDWLSSGAAATNGHVEFDGTGMFDPGGSSIDNASSTTGTRTVRTGSITGDFTLSGGALVIDNDQVMNVGGDGSFTGGSIEWPAVSDGTEEGLDIEGNVSCRSTVVASSNDAVFRCAGNWTSNSQFHMSSGTVELDGASPTELEGLAPGMDPSFSMLVLSKGQRTLMNDVTLTASTVQVETGATLDLTGVSADFASGLLSIDGVLSLGAGGRLNLGATVAAIISPSGTLEMLGDFGNPATISGLGGGGYLLSVDGTLDATNFEVEQVGAGGMVVAQAAVVNSLHAGVFREPSASFGSRLLDIRRPAPVTFHYVDFEDPAVVGTNNVRVLGGSDITFANSEGNFAGDTFENDPLGILHWTNVPTVVDSFTATPSADQVELDWITSAESNTATWVIQRAETGVDVFADIGDVAAAGPGNYNLTDSSVSSGTTYTYRLTEVKSHGERVDHADEEATPWTTGLPGNVLTVGPAGAFLDIQSAINASSGINPVVRVAAGTYAPFTVNPGKGALRIYTDGSGPVLIDTTTGPVTIQNLTVFDSVEIHDMEVGSGASPNEGVVIMACAGLVVLDEMTVHGGIGMPGVDITSSTRVSLQRSTIDGDAGVVVTGGSIVLAGRGSIDDIDVSGASNVRLAQVAPIPTIDGTSTVTTLPGIHADFSAPDYASLGQTWDVTYDGEPGGIYVTAYSTSLSWLDLPAPFEMVAMLNIVQSPQLSTGILGPVPTVQSLPMPGDGVLFGAVVPLQMVVVNATTFTFRWSNVQSVVLTN